MDDLISRAALIESLKKRAPKPTTDDLYKVNMCIIDAPTIDAIPVEWMRDKMRGYASALKSTETAALVRVLQMWEEEQEE